MMNLKTLCRVKCNYIVLFLCVVLGFKTQCYAQDTNDLLSLYNMEEIAGDDSIYGRVTDSANAYNNAVKDAELGEEYNSLYNTAKDYSNLQISKMNNEINKLLAENEEFTNEIQNNFDDWKEISNLDLKHKANVMRINSLLKQRSKITVADKINIDYSSISQLEQEMIEVKQEYNRTVNVMELGDVTNVKYPLNCDTEIVNNYGEIIDPVGKKDIIEHSGIDLRADSGTEVLALFDGVINTTGYGPLGGYYISVYHGSDIVSYYCHLSQINCKVGDKVKQYDVIGLSGDSGEETKVPLLHLGLYYKSNRMDPTVLFEK